MNKYFFPLVLFCLLAYSSQAQKMTPGIKGGLNITDVTGFNGDNRLSGHVGLFLNSRINARWSFQPEILYSGQGQQFPVSLRDDATLALSYIQVPLMFQFYPVRQFYVEFGPQIGFLLSANSKNNDDKAEIDEWFKKVDGAICFGAGIQATSMLGFYARYNAGIADISKNNNALLGNRDHYNRVGELGIAIKLK
ncbi:MULTISPECIES: porin family protein [Niastella]|uniref:PorT family protein n=1 Tax=Niastella soli TaxID=2821487 RepID=A0ABS3YPS7_9BACT|nr:porin family protein [Niastella soli]MBO9199904.1 PorT family protein [Niastella soli]